MVYSGCRARSKGDNTSVTTFGFKNYGVRSERYKYIETRNRTICHFYQEASPGEYSRARPFGLRVATVDRARTECAAFQPSKMTSVLEPYGKRYNRIASEVSGLITERRRSTLADYI